MTKNSLMYVVVVPDLLYIATLAVDSFLIGPLRSPDFAAMPGKIEASSSSDDAVIRVYDHEHKGYFKELS